MASIIKNQIVKHLSKFTKNLSPDKIQLSTLKGEGELTNLELNEDTLTELMDLPTWLKLTKAVCNKVNIRVPWSKLKSQPIRLYLDEVQVSMEMCEELRKPADSSGLPSYSSGGRYGFGDRVVDGMFLQINAVIIDFRSKAFQATVNLSRIVVQSKTPTWRNTADLQYTRVSEKQSDMLLTFKEIDWQTLRIEADCMVADNGAASSTTPLRLITNQSKVRLSVKKRYSDCSIIATKVQFIMDDLLWILTDSQMKAAVVFARHLKDKIDKSSEQSKATAAQTLQKQKQARTRIGSGHSNNVSPSTSLFLKFDIAESSYHIQSSRIDLHICDDINVPNRNRGVDGGAVGVAIMKLNISHYPTRTVGANRTKWAGYDENMASRDKWTNELLHNYVEQLTQEVAAGKYKLDKGITAEKVANSLVERLTTLYLEDFFVTTVSVEKEHGHRHKKLLMSDKKALFLPKEMSAVHVEHTEYFFPSQTHIPKPCDNAYIQINPIKFVLDTLTLTWMNSFVLSLAKDVEDLVAVLPIDNSAKKERLDFKLEALMPKIILPAAKPVQLQPDRPEGLQILISKLIITNNHLINKSNLAQLHKSAHTNLLEKSKTLGLHTDPTNFPGSKNDLQLIAPMHDSYSQNTSLAHTTHQQNHVGYIEMISVALEQFWLEFIGVRNAGSRPVSFVESFPVTVWIAMPQVATNQSSSQFTAAESKEQSTHKPLTRLSKTSEESGHSAADQMSLLVHIGAKVCAQLSHYQYCFLMRLADTVTEMMETVKNEMRLHSELLGGKSNSPAHPPITALLYLREVQFAMVAAPTVNLPQAPNGSEEQEDLLSNDATNGDSPISEEYVIDGYTGEVEMQANNEIAVSDVINTVVGSVDTDSGVGITSITSSVADSDTDTYLEKSVFYHDGTITDGGPRKNARSSFYITDTMLPGRSSPEINQTAMKISSAFSRMTTKVKASVAKVVDDPDNWDSLSINSGMSDDAEFLAELQTQEEEAAFTSGNVHGFNDDEESVASISTDRLKQTVSVTIFKICSLEVGAQVLGDDVTAKIALGTIGNEEIGNIFYDDFQNQQLAAMNVYEDLPATSKKPIRVRFTKGPSATLLAYGAEEKGFAEVQVFDYGLNLFATTVSKLGPLFADEFSGGALPLKVEVMNFDLYLEEVWKFRENSDDAVKIYLTEKPAEPVQLHINKMVMLRTVDGVFTIQGDTIPGQSAAHERPIRLPSSMIHQGTNTDMIDNYSENASCLRPAIRTLSSGTAQLLEEMKCTQQENKALKEQIMRLNAKLLQKDQEEFHRLEGPEEQNDVTSKLRLDLELRTVEIRQLKDKIAEDAEELEALRKSKDCLTQTVQLLQKDLNRFEQSVPPPT